MLNRTILIALVGSITAFGMPTSTHKYFEPGPGEGNISTNATLASNTGVTYYQGTPSTGSCGLMAVSSGSMSAGECTALKTYSLAIDQLEHHKCSFMLYKGTSSCSGPTSTETTQIAAGNGTVCVVTDVQDGGQFEKASGLWACSSGA